MTSKITELAHAYALVAILDNYMIGIVGDFTLGQLEEAKQILITEQNLYLNKLATFDELGLALDLIEQDIEKELRLASSSATEG